MDDFEVILEVKELLVHLVRPPEPIKILPEFFLKSRTLVAVGGAFTVYHLWKKWRSTSREIVVDDDDNDDDFNDDDVNDVNDDDDDHVSLNVSSTNLNSTIRDLFNDDDHGDDDDETNNSTNNYENNNAGNSNRGKANEYKKICVVCLDLPRNTCFFPCGHICVCFACSKRISSKCPICRATIRHIAQTFNV